MCYIERIQALREDRDLNQTAIARLLHVGQRTCSDYESGRIRISVESMALPAKFYNAGMDYICGVSDIPNPFPDQ